MILKKWIFVISAGAVVMSILNFEVRETLLIYDCSVAERHPDVPKEIRDACKKIRNKKVLIV